MPDDGHRPSRNDPLLIMAMDHRESFGRTLFGVTGEGPDPEQRAAMTAAKRLIYAGLACARAELACGRAGVLVDERYGQPVIEAGRPDGVILAVPVERGGCDWFKPEWGEQWLAHVSSVRPDFAKALVRDNPAFPRERRERQLRALRLVSDGLRQARVPLLYELLVSAGRKQLAAGRVAAYDRELHPAVVIQVIADHQAAGVEPAIWTIEGLETEDAAREVIAQIRAGGRDHVDAIVLGRDAPADRLDHWLAVAAPVDGFVGFAIGRSIWEGPIAEYNRGRADKDEVIDLIATRYLRFARAYCAASERALRAADGYRHPSPM